MIPREASLSVGWTPDGCSFLISLNSKGKLSPRSYPCQVGRKTVTTIVSLSSWKENCHHDRIPVKLEGKLSPRSYPCQVGRKTVTTIVSLSISKEKIQKKCLRMYVYTIFRICSKIRLKRQRIFEIKRPWIFEIKRARIFKIKRPLVNIHGKCHWKDEQKTFRTKCFSKFLLNKSRSYNSYWIVNIFEKKCFCTIYMCNIAWKPLP